MKRKDFILISALIMAGAPLTGKAQLSKSALDYMLQRPQVTKSYKDKKFMDHLFMDFGFGGNLMGRHNVKLGPIAEMGLGDWISPEHGVRLNFYGGAYKISGKETKYASVGLDYLLNITAIAQPGTHYSQHPFEVYGIAGIDLSYSRENKHNDHGFGAHMGLRGQYAFSPITYVYAETRVGVTQDNVSQVQTWRNLRPMASLTMGLGVRMPDVRRGNMRSYFSTPHSFADGLFAGVQAGPLFLGSAHVSDWHDNTGMSVAVSLGKWIDPCNAFRLNLNTTTFMQNDATRMRAIGARLDYMLNLHNAFGGLKPERRFWVNALAGIGFNYSRDWYTESRYSLNVGAGLQANVRLSRDIDFVLEPRFDLYNSRWAPNAYTVDKLDVTSSLMAGFVYTYHEEMSRKAHQAEDNMKMRRNSFALTGGMAVRLFQYDEWKRYMPVARISYTHWSAPMAGFRYSFQGMFGRPINERYYGAATGGFDWMTDLTAVSYGCDNSRVLSLRSVLGFNLGADHSEYTRLNSDLHAGGQLALRLSSHVNLLGEAQLGYEFTSRYKGYRSHRLQPQVQLGVEYNVQRSSRNKDLDEAPSRRNYVFLSAGTGVYTGNMGDGGSIGRRLTLPTDIGYGHWFSSLSGIQVALGNTLVPSPNLGSKTITALRADYMMNLKSAVTGEPSDDELVQFTGLLGAQVAVSTKEHRTPNYAPGLHAAMQAGLRVSPRVELYLEPSATLSTKNLEAPHWCNPAEVELRLSVGSKYHF